MTTKDQQQSDAFSSGYRFAYEEAPKRMQEDVRNITEYHKRIEEFFRTYGLTAVAEDFKRLRCLFLSLSAVNDLLVGDLRNKNKKLEETLATLREQRFVAGAHTDDTHIEKFATVMQQKMAKKRVEFPNKEWETAPVEKLAEMLVLHVGKGDPVDVANFCMMLSEREAPRGVLTAAFNKWWETFGKQFMQSRAVVPLDVDSVAVPSAAINWLKEKYPALCEKSGLCERIGGRLYTKTFLAPAPAPTLAPANTTEDHRHQGYYQSSIDGHAYQLYIEADAVRIPGHAPRSAIEGTKPGMYIDVFCGACDLGLCAIVKVGEVNNTYELEVPPCPRCAGVLK